MPLAADVDRLVDPACVVCEPAAAQVSTRRTSAAVEVAVRSTRKSAGSVAVADVPIVLKSWRNGVVVEIEIAANATNELSATSSPATSSGAA